MDVSWACNRTCTIVQFSRKPCTRTVGGTSPGGCGGASTAPPPQSWPRTVRRPTRRPHSSADGAAAMPEGSAGRQRRKAAPEGSAGRQRRKAAWAPGVDGGRLKQRGAVDAEEPSTWRSTARPPRRGGRRGDELRRRHRGEAADSRCAVKKPSKHVPGVARSPYTATGGRAQASWSSRRADARAGWQVTSRAYEVGGVVEHTRDGTLSLSSW